MDSHGDEIGCDGAPLEYLDRIYHLRDLSMCGRNYEGSPSNGRWISETCFILDRVQLSEPICAVQERLTDLRC
ncbi:hypothetical protein CDAR_587371 [Caerostris darwini]|uniref:Uncharacterized protein n=1 Tax=Caerostris darwini TaxID=1538125 RepID=A0AAV4SKD9_9ARAC|nr:hypothetical protein CDAR_587371 [Caerostris darwini]